MAEKKEEQQTLQPSGPKQPTMSEIVKNHKAYRFQIADLEIVPTVNIYKDDVLVSVIRNGVIQKLPGTINTNYSKEFLDDVVNDFLFGMIRHATRQAGGKNDIQS